MAAGLIFWTGCRKKDDPAPVNENELITTIIIEFTNDDDPQDKVTIEWEDLDGDGSQEPVITSGNLRVNSTYSANVKFLDKVNNKDVTEEIEEEDDEHQVYYGFSDQLFTSFEYLDEDRDGKPLGLKFRVTTGQNPLQNASLRVILVHEPDKSRNNPDTPWVYNEDIGDDIDIDATLRVNLVSPNT